MKKGEISHVAIIMDGNRRWAKKGGFGVKAGHEKGAEHIEDILAAAKEQGVKTLTLYAFSTENWKRSSLEVNFLMALLEKFLRDKRSKLVESDVKLSTIGDCSRLPPQVLHELSETSEATKENRGINLVLALNYGARDEIVRAAKKMATEYAEKKIDDSCFSEEGFSRYLDTAPWGDPDLLIRTSGESRVSNFLLWQISYTEIYMTETLWPDFTAGEFSKALEAFKKRERRLGE